MKKPILSLPIDKAIDAKLKKSVKAKGVSRADVVREILRVHYGLQKRDSAA